MSKKSKDITGVKFNMLTVLEYRGKNEDGNHLWWCKCDCGNEKLFKRQQLGSTKSCGCLNSKHVKYMNMNDVGKPKIKRIASIWTNMMGRCTNPEYESFKYYGARGIKVCNQWTNDYFSFQEWALNNGYDEKLTLDRIDCNGNYEPNNCRWATYKEQNRNTRKNRFIEINGETKTIGEWSEITGIERTTIENRIKRGLQDVDIIKPVRKKIV